MKSRFFFHFVFLFLLSLSAWAQRIGIYTGTFDPPHIAHKMIVEETLKSNLVDEVYVVPDDKTPFKPNKSSIKDRLAMVKLMFQGRSEVKFLTQEMNDKIVTGEMWNVYHAIKSVAKPDESSLMMGADTFLKFKSFSVNFLDRDFSLIVFTRGGEIEIPFRIENQNVHKIESQMEDISSTKIREAVKNGDVVNDLTPEVLNYIKAHGLYL